MRLEAEMAVSLSAKASSDTFMMTRLSLFEEWSSSV